MAFSTGVIVLVPTFAMKQDLRNPYFLSRLLCMNRKVSAVVVVV